MASSRISIQNVLITTDYLFVSLDRISKFRDSKDEKPSKDLIVKRNPVR